MACDGHDAAAVDAALKEAASDPRPSLIACHTTIGFGDISPVGDIKYLTGLQALTGLVLITWTASFLFLEMQKYWKRK